MLLFSFRTSLLFLSLASLVTSLAADSEAEVIAFFQERGDRVTLNDGGHAVKLFSGGKPALSVAEMQRIGKLPMLEELALNAAPGAYGDWAFLQDLKKLKLVRIWHGHHFASLESFSGIAAEDLLIGGCMGLRDLNKETPDKQRDAILTLRNLPNLKKLSVYHSPLTPDDSHLAHIVKEFPNLIELRVDFAAPRNQEIRITPDGLAGLAALPLTRLAVEKSEALTPGHFAALAKIKTLQKLHIYPPRSEEFDYGPLLAELKEARPDLEITYQGK